MELINNDFNFLKEEIKRNKLLLEEYKKLKNNEFFIDNIIYFDNIGELLKNDYKELKFSMFLKILCELIGLISLAITIYFKYNILFFPFNNLLEYAVTILFMYYSAMFFDYTKECIKEDINTLSNLKHTLKQENKTIVK